MTDDYSIKIEGLILQFNPVKLAEAKVALAVHQTRTSIEDVIIKSCTLR